MTPPDFFAEDADDPSKSVCLPCQVGLHDACLFLTRPTSCGCACPWLTQKEPEC